MPKNITLGKFNDTKEEALSNLTSLIGRNSSGKSSFFEVFSFISDCLNFGVEEAIQVRGGLANLISKETDLVKQKDQFNKTTSSTIIAEISSSTWFFRKFVEITEKNITIFISAF